jgi:hypothetical protein
MLASAYMWLVRIEVGKPPTSYRVQGTEAHVYKDFRKRFTEKELTPIAWIAYPRNAKLSRIAAVALDWTLEDATKRARALLSRIGKRQ